MLIIKLHGNLENIKKDFMKTVTNISDFLSGKLNLSKAKVITEKNGVEIISGNEGLYDGDIIIAELTIRKSFIINKNDFNDKSKLDKFLYQIKSFCEKAESIEEEKFIPHHMRD